MPEESAEMAGRVPMEQEGAERTHRVIRAFHPRGEGSRRYGIFSNLAVDCLFKKTEQMLRDLSHFKVKREMRPYGKGWGLHVMSGNHGRDGGRQA